ncbi:MAG: ribonucleotide-diphosphate reductase subunit beta [Bacteroidales bacterium]|nr:ribonucleotide-diphosphate reductase subunit beta [Candidatus Scybalousia scybalohippi]
MSTVFNEKNKGHITKHYPMFLGDSLGLLDTVNVTNEAVEALKEKQRGGRWYPTEISMAQDRQDMVNAPKHIVDIMSMAISWQHTTDSIAGRSIGAMFLPYVTNPEAEVMISEWSTIEFVHGEAYSHIVKQTRLNPDEAIQETYNNIRVLNRSKKIIEVFNSLYNMDRSLPFREKQKIVAKVLCTVMAMECISFMSSFAVTFAIAEQGWFQGIAETVSLISRDELYHTRMSYELIKAQKEVDGWQDVYDEISDEVSEIVSSIARSEMEWNRYLLSEGRYLDNLSLDMLDKTNKYFNNAVFTMLGLKNPLEVVTENPCKFMEKYIDRSLLQFASQEIQHGSYRQGSIVDDVTEDLDLEFII